MRSFVETQNGAISSNGQFPFGRVLIWPESTARSWGEEEEEESFRSFIAAAATAAAILFSTAVSAARSSSGIHVSQGSICYFSL